MQAVDFTGMPKYTRGDPGLSQRQSLGVGFQIREYTLLSKGLLPDRSFTVRARRAVLLNSCRPVLRQDLQRAIFCVPHPPRTGHIGIRPLSQRLLRRSA
jgi:hypothetical protein